MDSQLMLYAVMAGILLGFCTIYLIIKMFVVYQRKKKWVHVSACCEDTEITHGARGSTGFRVTYSYRGPDGSVYYGNYPDNHKVTKGESVEIYYNPDNPNKSFALRRIELDKWALLLTGVLTVVCGAIWYANSWHKASPDYYRSATAYQSRPSRPPEDLPWGKDEARLDEDKYIAFFEQPAEDESVQSGESEENVSSSANAGGSAGEDAGDSTGGNAADTTGSEPAASSGTPAQIAVIPVSKLCEIMGSPEEAVWETSSLEQSWENDFYLEVRYWDGTSEDAYYMNYITEESSAGGQKRVRKENAFSCGGRPVNLVEISNIYEGGSESGYLTGFSWVDGGSGTLIVEAGWTYIPEDTLAQTDMEAHKVLLNDYLKLIWENIDVIEEDYDRIEAPGPCAKRVISAGDTLEIAHTGAGTWKADSIENLDIEEASIQYLTVVDAYKFESRLKMMLNANVYINTEVDDESIIPCGDREVTFIRVSGNKKLGRKYEDSNKFIAFADYYEYTEINDAYVLAKISVECNDRVDDIVYLTRQIFSEDNMPAYFDENPEPEKVDTVPDTNPAFAKVGAPYADLQCDKYILDQDEEGNVRALAEISMDGITGNSEILSIENWNTRTISYTYLDGDERDQIIETFSFGPPNQDTEDAFAETEEESSGALGRGTLIVADRETEYVVVRQYHTIYYYYRVKTEDGDYFYYTYEIHLSGSQPNDSVLLRCPPNDIGRKMAARITVSRDDYSGVKAAGPLALRKVQKEDTSSSGQFSVYVPSGDGIWNESSIEEMGIRDDCRIGMQLKYTLFAGSGPGYSHYYGCSDIKQSSEKTIYLDGLEITYKMINGVGGSSLNGKKFCDCSAFIRIPAENIKAVTEEAEAVTEGGAAQEAEAVTEDADAAPEAEAVTESGSAVSEAEAVTESGSAVTEGGSAAQETGAETETGSAAQEAGAVTESSSAAQETEAVTEADTPEEAEAVTAAGTEESSGEMRDVGIQLTLSFTGVRKVENIEDILIQTINCMEIAA